MIVHQDHCKNWLEDNAIQQDGRDIQKGPLISFDLGIKNFEELFSPIKMALPQASSVGILAPLLPQPSEQARGSNLGKKSAAEKPAPCFY